MADLSKIRKNGVDYDIKDSVARAAIEELQNGDNIDLSGYVQSVNGVTPDENGNVDVAGGSGCDVSVEGEKLFITDDVSKHEYELLETIICDGTYNSISMQNLALKEVKIYMQTEASETAHSVAVEMTNDSALFGYAWIPSLINTAKRYSYVHGVSDGVGDAYIEASNPSSTKYTAATLMRTPTKYDGTTPIKKVSIYAADKAMIPADSIIEIWGVRA